MLAGLALAVVAKPSVGQQTAPDPAVWTVPEIGALPNDAHGRLMRRGRDLLTATYALIGPLVANPAKRYAGNNLACASCHLQAATKMFGLPLFGLAGDYPRYNARSSTEITLVERLNACMTRSMNGRPLSANSSEMTAIVAYLLFLSTGLPPGKSLPGLGSGDMPELDRAANPGRGQHVYAKSCAACHNADGSGFPRIWLSANPGYMVPPLWGPDSFNNGAAGGPDATPAGRPCRHALRLFSPVLNRLPYRDITGLDAAAGPRLFAGMTPPWKSGTIAAAPAFHTPQQEAATQRRAYAIGIADLDRRTCRTADRGAGARRRGEPGPGRHPDLSDAADAPPSFDAHREGTFATVYSAAPFYSVLIRVDPNNPASATDFVCDLCTEMPRPTEDGKTYTFKIRQGVKWHDGSPLTADDVAASWNKIIDPPEGVSSARQSHFMMVDKVGAPDRSTVVFHLKFATSAFLPALADPFTWIYKKEDPR
jgi:cytochrome c